MIAFGFYINWISAYSLVMILTNTVFKKYSFHKFSSPSYHLEITNALQVKKEKEKTKTLLHYIFTRDFSLYQPWVKRFFGSLSGEAQVVAQGGSHTCSSKAWSSASFVYVTGASPPRFGGVFSSCFPAPFLFLVRFLFKSFLTWSSLRLSLRFCLLLPLTFLLPFSSGHKACFFILFSIFPTFICQYQFVIL